LLPSPTQYLVSRHWGNWAFTDNIEIATKAMSPKVAAMIKNNYCHDLGMDVELVIIPIEIEYKILKEIDV